jgi:lipopolysaccharide export system ATP-binding protein
MIRNRPPQSWIANVLDGFLALFRRRRSPIRQRSPAAVDDRWGLNLATLGGLIGLGRADRIPRDGPPMRPRRSYEETDDWQPAPSYAQHPGENASPQTDDDANWQAAQYAGHAEHTEPPAPLHARRGDVATRSAPVQQSYQPPQQEQQAEERNYLAAHAVEKTFGDRKVVKGASLYVRRGEAVGLLGPNGAGKTTIFYMMTGLIGADRGHVELDGHDVTSLPMYQRARLGIGYLPQEASIFRGLSVEENIRAVLEVVEPNKKRRERDLDALLEEFNIARLRKAPAIALSGGERRRCEIARALASRPNYMLLDEPFAGIDPIAVGDIQQLVRHLTNRGIGVLITDHNVRETLGLTDRAYIIYSGEVLMEGRADDIVNNPEVRRLYLGEDFSL